MGGAEKRYGLPLDVFADLHKKPRIIVTSHPLLQNNLQVKLQKTRRRKD